MKKHLNFHVFHIHSIQSSNLSNYLPAVDLFDSPTTLQFKPTSKTYCTATVPTVGFRSYITVQYATKLCAYISLPLN